MSAATLPNVATQAQIVQARNVSKIFKRDAFEVKALDNVTLEIGALAGGHGGVVGSVMVTVTVVPRLAKPPGATELPPPADPEIGSYEASAVRATR